MCFNSGAKEAKAEAARIRQEEAARQQRVRQGTSDIGRIFEGGRIGVGQLGANTAYDPNARYYTATGDIWSPGATSQANPQIQFLKALKDGLFSGTEVSTGAFGGDFFDKRAEAFKKFAMPQLEDQRSDAARELTFALARDSNLDTSTRATKEGKLQKLYDIQRQSVIDQGQSYANQARTSVEDARSDLIKTLNATGDAQGAASGAINRAAALSQPDKFDPLGQLFADFTGRLGSQYALERAEASAQKDYARHNLGLFKPGRTTVTGLG